METKLNNDIKNNKKIEYALCSIMFFAPLIKKSIKSDNQISIEEKNFISGFIKLGYTNIFLLIIAIINILIYLNTTNIIYKKISIGIAILIGIILFFGTILVILDKNINKNSNTEFDYNKIINFIPIYNIYLRYNKHNFEGDHNNEKSGIILRNLFTIALLCIKSTIIKICILIYILFKAIYSANGLSFGKKRDSCINKIFKKNPEEIRGYITGTIISIFNGKSINENINKQKEKYELIIKTTNTQIAIEYIILGLICIFLGYTGITNSSFSIIISICFIIMRYLIMIIKWEHVPHLPILKEITDIFFNHKNKVNE